MGERAVWSPVLHDIVEVIPLRIVRHIIPMMSTRDIRRTAIQATRIDCLFDKCTMKPARVQRIDLDADVVSLEIGHGGQWILTMRDDGSLHLHRIRNTTLEESMLVASRPVHDAPRYWNHEQMYVILSSWRQAFIAVTHEHYATLESVFQ